MSNVDVIGLEVLRTRLDSLVDEAGRAIARTAISPVVVEAGDFSVTLLDADGGLITGGGKIRHHFGAASNFIAAIIERHLPTIADGDVFLGNDPHHGGGLHAQDVFVGRPVIVDGELVAWVAVSAHMMDMGGMVPGSFAPAAVECYAEAFRTPPVRLFSGGVEQNDIWTILMNNIRIADLVEMDLRGLIAGLHVATRELLGVVSDVGAPSFRDSVDELRRRSATELSRRISRLESGTYGARSWVEWGDELFELVCTLYVRDGRLTFDFDGSAKQTPHFFNSKPHIVAALIAVDLLDYLAPDIPYNGGYFDTVSVRCPEGSIVNCTPPAPVAAAHLYVGSRCTELAIRTFLAAVAASAEPDLRALQNSGAVGSAVPLVTWAGPGLSGADDAWLMLDGSSSGAPAAIGRDGNDFYFTSIGQGSMVEFQDIEVTESWYPLRFDYKQSAVAEGGDGQWRAGAATELAFSVDGSSGLFGVALGNRGRVPFDGGAGGLPGSVLAYRIERADGSSERVDVLEQNIRLGAGDRFVMRAPRAGGWGDPLERDPQLVERDVESNVLTAERAAGVYGVVIGDHAATESRRDEMRRDRLSRATAPAHAVCVTAEPGEHGVPLAPGVEQRGDRAVSVRSGAVLAESPHHWTEGCPVLDDVVGVADGLTSRAYLDPVTGTFLLVEVVPVGAPCSTWTLPDRWLTAAKPPR